jgi:adenine-specific DNA-methyltransferase
VFSVAHKEKAENFMLFYGRTTHIMMRNPYQRYQKLQKPPLQQANTTLWSYVSQHYGARLQGNPQYRGATPSHVIWQFMQRYTKEGQTILDPFCGSGTTVDVARDLRRKAIGFDLQPHHPDVKEADARHLPLKENSVDHAFFDPPYADNLRYSQKPNCIGESHYHDGSWQDAIHEVFLELDRVVKAQGFIAVFVCDIKKKNGDFYPLGAELYQLCPPSWRVEDHCVIPRESARLDHQRPRVGEHLLLRGFSHCIIFQRPHR